MGRVRPVKRVVEGREKRGGAGVKLTRVISRRDAEEFDPFLFLDAFDSSDPADYIKGFPWHPHRGIETVTYLMEGVVGHGDSLGNKGMIIDGDCQWMTAGSGIIHQEIPRESNRLFGTQLWVNLPARDKMIPPKYRDIKAQDIPVIEAEGITVKLIAGADGGVKGPMEEIAIKPTYMDVSVAGGGLFTYETNPEDTLFIYLLEGSGHFGEDKTPMEGRKAVLFDEGEEFMVQAQQTGVRFLLFSGRPLREPVAWRGSIVMNTEEELDRAYREVEAGTFLKQGS